MLPGPARRGLQEFLLHKVESPIIKLILGRWRRASAFGRGLVDLNASAVVWDYAPLPVGDSAVWIDLGSVSR